MSLVSILVVLIIAGLILWAVGQFPLDPTIMRIIRVVVIVFVVIWLLQAFFGLRGNLRVGLDPAPGEHHPVLHLVS